MIGTKTCGEGFGCSHVTMPLMKDNYVGKLIGDREIIVKGINLSLPVEAPLNEFGVIDYENLYKTIPNIECSSNQALEVALSLIELDKSYKNN